MIKKTILTILVLLLFLGGILYISSLKNKSYQTIIYSWDLEKINENKKQFQKTIESYQIDTIYQDFKKDYLKASDDEFIKEMQKKKISVYHLAGDPTWGKKDGFTKTKEELELVKQFNKKTKNKLKGVVLDIEPYIDEKEENFKIKDFQIYVEEIKKTYKYCKENELELILVIPYWFDDIDENLLEELIQNTDGISVMNYNINKTKQKIKTEIKLAKKYQKKIDTIYEVNYKEKGYFSSKEEIIKDYEKLKKEYKLENLGLAFHHYGSMK